MSQSDGGYFGVADMWNSKNNAIKPQGIFWDKIDAFGMFFMRFSIILWIISLIISIISWFMLRDIKNYVEPQRTSLTSSGISDDKQVNTDSI